MKKNPLERALEIIGGNATPYGARQAVAELCGVTRQAVEYWETVGVPGKHVLTLEGACDGKVTVRELLEWSAERRKAAA